MKNYATRLFLKSVTMACALCLGAVTAHANFTSLSRQGTLANAQSSFSLVFTVGGTGAQTVQLQTWGFGGGTNAAGTLISPGGFDPLLALFAGSGASASLIDGTSDVLSNSGSYVGCPPAGTVAFSNGDAVCGDITMSFSLAPGTYTVILSDADYIPAALFDNGTLGEGFVDFTGGVFQTCDTNLSTGGMSCITPTNAWAFDITAGSLTEGPTPEPASLLLLGTGLLALAAWRRRRAIAHVARRSALEE